MSSKVNDFNAVVWAIWMIWQAATRLFVIFNNKKECTEMVKLYLISNSIQIEEGIIVIYQGSIFSYS